MDFETYIDIDALEPEVGRLTQTPRVRLLRAMVAARAVARMRCLSVSHYRRLHSLLLLRYGADRRVSLPARSVIDG